LSILDKSKIFFTESGVDRAVLYTVLSRLIQGIGGLVAILLISIFLTKEEQGYYVTFGSILAIQVFLELGLSSIITQFVAHEMAELDSDLFLINDGSSVNLSRLASLLRFFCKWFLISAFILFFLLSVCGFLFFSTFGSSSDNSSWFFPWIILSISTTLLFFLSPFLFFLEGMGKVAQVAKIKLIQQIVQTFILFTSLAGGLKLFSAPIANVCSLLIIPIFIYYSGNLKLFIKIWKSLGKSVVDYRREIFPMQWKIGVSWISGYFMYQLFNPIIFASEGAAVAGQMGVTLAVLNGILTMSLSWVNTKVSLFSTLIVKKQFEKLDNVFNSTIRQAGLANLILLSFFVLSVSVMKKHEIEIGNRFLPIFPTFLLALTTLINLYISSVGIYLRCHKEEPLLIFSLVMAVLTAMSTIYLGVNYGVFGISLGYSALTVFVSYIWVSIIFKRKKLLWH
jgi:O-antigen/teichoic acid export membrane protein